MHFASIPSNKQTRICIQALTILFHDMNHEFIFIMQTQYNLFFRNCIGQHFAMHELRTVMATCLRNFEFAVDEDKPAQLQPKLIIRSKGGLWLKLKAIN